MKKRKILAAALALLILLQLFAGCSSVARFDATLYGYTNDWMDEAFLKENRIKGAWYDNEDYVPHTSGVKKGWYEENAPESRTFIITTKEEYASFFPSSTVDINFEKEIVVLYMCLSVTPRGYCLKDLKVSDDVLTVKVEQEPVEQGIKDACMPYARCFMLKMKKTDIDQVVFKEIEKINGEMKEKIL